MKMDKNKKNINETVITLNDDDLCYIVTESVKRLVNNINESSKNKTKKKAITQSLKTRIISILRQDEIDKAPYAYKLWPKKDKDSARSYFYKCLNQKKNEDGVPYSFTDKEFTKLYSLLSNLNMI